MIGAASRASLLNLISVTGSRAAVQKTVRPLTVVRQSRALATSVTASPVAGRAKAKPVPPPRGSISTPTSFVSAIAGKNRGDLSSVLSALGGEEASWAKMFAIDGSQLKEAGVNVKERRYFLWALEKYRQGLDPSDFVIDQKPKKKVRGWGPRVQNGIRVRGRRRPNEK